MATQESRDDDWTTIVSKKTQRKEKIEKERQRTEQIRMKRDMRYLHTHVSFQKHRINREKALEILKTKGISSSGTNLGTTLNSLFIVSNGRCVGHLILVENNKPQICLQCDWKAESGFVTHCCCPGEVESCLPQNFYLGCDGYLNDYLTKMMEEPLNDADLESN